MQQHTGPRAEHETTKPTERQPTTTRESSEGETSQLQSQPPMGPQTEEQVTTVTSEPEPTPQENKDPQKAASTRELAGADMITQQPQTDVPAKMITREPLDTEPTTEGIMDPNKPEEQELVTQDGTVTPDSALSAPQRQDQQLSNNAIEKTKTKLGQDIRAESGILNILEDE